LLGCYRDQINGLIPPRYRPGVRLLLFLRRCVRISLRALRGPAAGVVCGRGAGRGAAPASAFGWALLSVELLVAVVSVLVFAPFVDPLPASFADAAPVVGPLPASAFGCANVGAERPTAITERSKLPRNRDMGSAPRFDHGKFRLVARSQRDL
jgi:hypothetical protein